MLIVTFLAVGCSTADDTPDSKPTIQSASTPPSSVPTATTVPHDECEDGAGDGGALDLKSVTIDADESSEVTIVFDLNSPLPPTGTAELGIYVLSADGRLSRQLAVKWVDGKSTGPFVFDMGETTQDNVGEDNLMQKSDKYVVATFPGAAVADLGKNWKWSAFANAAGHDTDACPGAAGAMKYQRFAGKTEGVQVGEGAWNLGNQG